ncbi:outer membrane protein assembly factor BamD [Lichenihabitans sp. Uapishka_5]|uniref:outer membrane protein assembly factor BamD n=1 Tax=Lichenihabitans sp. Uapishka_5 TaxID=3037302 RepID=UPI0029E828A9|nr:outer membrane protein assembly factor BamD [Lichenihabitans sp. Uapishka_5]MDX7952251.1 outer membrane protein assembly factor BamD [Lichenihabitans sp. Uapishka_5]
MSGQTSFRWRSRIALRVICLGATALPLAACSTFEGLNPFSGEKYETKILPDVPADDIYNQGIARTQAHDTEGAVKKFGQLEKDFAYSDYARRGLLMQTYAQYNGGNYDDAVESGARYVKLYPNTPDTPYALYLQAMSQYSQVPDISRDQGQSAKALELFEQIVQKYPNSEYANDAKFKIQVARDQLAGKEMSIGRFYLARKNYTAAINRFREVLAKYQTTRHTEEALMRLTEAYMGLGITDEAQTAAAILGHNFPDSEWYKDSYALLKDNGLEPHENQGSWISQAFHKIGLSG